MAYGKKLGSMLSKESYHLKKIPTIITEDNGDRLSTMLNDNHIIKMYRVFYF